MGPTITVDCNNVNVSDTKSTIFKGLGAVESYFLNTQKLLPNLQHKSHNIDG